MVDRGGEAAQPLGELAGAASGARASAPVVFWEGDLERSPQEATGTHLGGAGLTNGQPDELLKSDESGRPPVVPSSAELVAADGPSQSNALLAEPTRLDEELVTDGAVPTTAAALTAGLMRPPPGLSLEGAAAPASKEEAPTTLDAESLPKDYFEEFSFKTIPKRDISGRNRHNTHLTVRFPEDSLAQLFTVTLIPKDQQQKRHGSSFNESKGEGLVEVKNVSGKPLTSELLVTLLVGKRLLRFAPQNFANVGTQRHSQVINFWNEVDQPADTLRIGFRSQPANPGLTEEELSALRDQASAGERQADQGPAEKPAEQNRPAKPAPPEQSPANNPYRSTSSTDVLASGNLGSPVLQCVTCGQPLLGNMYGQPGFINAPPFGVAPGAWSPLGWLPGAF